MAPTWPPSQPHSCLLRSTREELEAVQAGAMTAFCCQLARLPSGERTNTRPPRAVFSSIRKRRRDISAVVGCAESALESHQDRTEPVSGETNYARGFEAGYCFAHVALLMNTPSLLIGPAGLEWERNCADGADGALS